MGTHLDISGQSHVVSLVGQGGKTRRPGQKSLGKL